MEIIDASCFVYEPDLLELNPEAITPKNLRAEN